MKNITPFKIEVDQTVLNDLQNRLQHTRWPDEPEGAEWNYGTNPTYLKELLTYWQKDYDWRKHESALNAIPQFKAEIDGINIHFIHIKGKGKNPKPLLLTHGWPDSFYRFYKVIPLLTDPQSADGNSEQSFDLIIPSLPGFGFSDRVALNTDQVAALWAKLMTAVLGYEQYYAAGGDIGAIVTKSLANQQPDRVIAIHLTDVGYPNGQEDWSTMSAPEQEFGQFIQQWWYTEGAYNMIQSTKPQTLGYGLNDSPAGLAAWITEKFNSWSDTDGNIENSFTKDELITNIMIYWVSQTINTSIRTYLENARAGWSGQPSPSAEYVKTPTAVSIFPAEAPVPIEWAQRMVNVKRFNKMEKGGHFAALEVPDAWVNELRSFFYSL
ncbi:epoxide hydrolase family protein [Pedobacter sp. UBA5917]|jgi:pimeloyl-ACP methyl ester carboxylesterase|uniref:epoxide hydrolase family protein n=1 Tax=Pedobacter sp. UBA5917 TaxID=1947061 RepID=UPI0025DCAF02|nr:epoxide hydrolase family protein [Pedobacter sp. UBA5917]